MSRVVMMCGPAGSGKSTVAKRLEAEGMVRLSIDHEAWKRGVRSMPLTWPQIVDATSPDAYPGVALYVGRCGTSCVTRVRTAYDPPPSF